MPSLTPPHLARAHNLSAYDAAYLELAIRRGLPLACLDGKLKAAGGWHWWYSTSAPVLGHEDTGGVPPVPPGNATSATRRTRREAGGGSLAPPLNPSPYPFLLL